MKKIGGYSAIHKWLSNNFEKSTTCEMCKQKSDRIHWAKITGKNHEHKRENYWCLCPKCHAYYDGFHLNKNNLGKHWKIKDTSNMSGRNPWNKGLIGFQAGHRPYNTKPNKTSIKKGQRLSPKTEFKKGCIPANKGKKFMNGHYV